MSTYTVVYDACVLYPAPLRDLLIQLAAAPLFRAKWTEEIHREWIDAVLHSRSDLTREQLERTKQLMDEAVLDANVIGYEHLIQSISLPDPKDRHVVAAAIHARADAIVTFNLRDFPPTPLASYNLEAMHPDDFITYQADLEESAVVIAAQKCRSRLRCPPISPVQYLDTLEAQSLPKTSRYLRQFASVL